MRWLERRPASARVGGECVCIGTPFTFTNRSEIIFIL
jgi:hypothetical protein